MRTSFLHFLLLLGSSHGFCTDSKRKFIASSSLQVQNCNNENNKSGVETNFLLGFKNNILSAGTAATIMVSTITAGTAALGAPPAANGLEISSGAFVIETVTKGETLLNAELDSKSIINTLFKNRKELVSSFSRIQKTITEELDSPAWMTLKKEFLQFEGDVAPDVRILPPSNWQQTVRDIQKGRLNFVLNGEVVNLSVDPTFSESEDDLVIRVVGFKGMPVLETATPEVIASNAISESWNAFWDFWHAPLAEPYSKYLPDGVEVDTGGAILSGSALATVGAYIASYSYYLSEIEALEAEAAAKREKLAEKAKAKKAAIAKKEAQAKKASREAKRATAETETAAEKVTLEEETKETEREESKEEYQAKTTSDSGKKRRWKFWKKQEKR